MAAGAGVPAPNPAPAPAPAPVPRGLGSRSCPRRHCGDICCPHCAQAQQWCSSQRGEPLVYVQRNYSEIAGEGGKCGKERLRPAIMRPRGHALPSGCCAPAVVRTRFAVMRNALAIANAFVEVAAPIHGCPLAGWSAGAPLLCWRHTAGAAPSPSAQQQLLWRWPTSASIPLYHSQRLAFHSITHSAVLPH